MERQPRRYVLLRNSAGQHQRWNGWSGFAEIPDEAPVGLYRLKSPADKLIEVISRLLNWLIVNHDDYQSGDTRRSGHGRQDIAVEVIVNDQFGNPVIYPTIHSAAPSLCKCIISQNTVLLRSSRGHYDAWKKRFV